MSATVFLGPNANPKIAILKQKYKYLPIQFSERDIKGKHYL